MILLQQDPLSSTLFSRLFYSALAGLTVLGFLFLEWNFLGREDPVHIDRISVATASSIESLIRYDLDARNAGLIELAHDWRLAGGSGRFPWSKGAQNNYSVDPGYQAIEWLDRSLQHRSIEPLDDNRFTQYFDLRSNPDALQLATLARDTSAPVLLRATDPLQDQELIVLYLPVYRDDSFDGLMVAVLSIDEWLGILLPSDLINEYAVTVSIDGWQVYSQQAEATVSASRIKATEFSAQNLNWRVAVEPNADFLASIHLRFTNWMLVTGFSLSTLVSMAVFFGMTSRQRALQIRKNLEHVQTLFKNLPGMSYLRGAYYPWPMDFVSDGSQALCGYGRADLESKSILWGDLIHPDDLEQVKKSILDAVSDRSQFELEYRIRSGSGVDRWMWERGFAVSDVNSEDVFLEGFITDITDRKRDELVVIAARSYSEAIVNAAIDAVITVGADDRIRSFNRQAEVIFGYTMEEAIGLSFQLLLADKYHLEHQQYINYFHATGKLKHLFVRRQMQLVRKDGTDFPAYFSVHEMEHQEQRQFVCMVRDISQEVAAEQQVREQREQLAHVDRLSMLGEMASSIAHEVNQPLTAISLFSQAGKRLLESGKLQQLPDVFDKLSQHSQRASAVIERMQAMSRRQVRSQEVVDCNRLVREIVVLAEAVSSIWDIVIEVQLSDELPAIIVDRVQIQQVVLNLLRNGMESMRSSGCQHGNTITIETRVVDADTIEIRVIDTGCGVSEEEAESIFTAFSTTKESGMGLGLSISQAIVTAHGGLLQFRNNDSIGAVFSFTLPIAKPGREEHE